jgi:membrane protein implicated in regulation of membrane protease activity
MAGWVWWIVAAGGLASALGAAPALSVGVFALVSVALLGVVRPIARRQMRTPRAVRTGVAALVGTEAVVLEAVDGNDGRIKLAGEVWSARAYDGDSVFVVGQRVHVLEIDGATALVAG